MYHIKTWEAAKGRWRGILAALGVPQAALSGRHGPCPLCGGKDRFRWDNKEGSGSYICAACGAGTGFQLAQRFVGGEFADVAGKIDALLGNIKHDPAQRPALSDDEKRAGLRRLYAESAPIRDGDLASVYLASRGFPGPTMPCDLRFAPRIYDGQGGLRPAMVAVVRDAEGKPANLHRTFLAPDGMSKADCAEPRKIMPGSIPAGAAVRLAAPTMAGELGIAEGIETALACERLFDLPVWSAINAGGMAKWAPPPGVSDVAIFGDCDESFTGQAAAYALARRLVADGVSVVVRIPDTMGQDWADVWGAKCG